MNTLLETIQSSEDVRRDRDYALIYLGFRLGLRVGEVVRLHRNHFRDLGKGIIYIPTLKRTPRIPVTCSCKRVFRVGRAKIGTKIICSKCGKKVVVTDAKNIAAKFFGPPEIELPVVTESVAKFCQEFLKSMPENREYLFPGQVNKTARAHLCERQVQKIFGHYLALAGLDKIYGYHSLRHGLGVLVADVQEDVLAVRDMLRHASSATSERYVHMSQKKKNTYKEALEKAYE